LSHRLDEVKKEKCALCGNYHLKGEDCPTPPVFEFKAAKADKCEKCGNYHLKDEACPTKKE
jgi:ribosomal protein L32